MIAATHNGSSAEPAPRKIRDILGKSGDREKKKLGLVESMALKAREIEGARRKESQSFAGPSLDYYKNAEGWKPTATCTLPDLIDAIKSEEYRDRVERIRGLIEAGDKKQADELKRLLPAVSPSGCITSGGRKAAVDEGRFTHTGFLQIDLDGKDHPGMSLDDMRDKLYSDPHIQAIFVSPSGNGVKGVARIPADAKNHKAAFLVAEKHFAAQGLKIDPSCKDPVRLCFVSYDPHAWLRPVDAKEFEVDPAMIDQREPRQDRAADDDQTPATSPARIERKNSGSGIVIHSGNAGAEITLADVPSILAVMSRQDYREWLEVISGLWNTFGEEVTPIIAAQWPEERPNEYAEKFKHKLKDFTLGTVLHHAINNGWRGRSPALRATAARLSNAPLPDDFPDLTRFGESDADNALRVFAVAGGNFHYVSETGQWIVWDGFRWTVDRDGKMVRLFLNVMDGTARQGLAAGKGGESVVKFSMRCRDSAKVMSGLSMLKSVEGVTIGASDLDADPWVIGTPGGMIDLKTGRAIQPDKRRLVTKSISCDLDPAATCPTWLRVIHTATAGDAELIRFLQAWFGYNLTGLTSEECLVFFYGLGANGKGTVTETCRKLMGDYAITAPESLFTTDRNSSATNDIARLAGCRMACAAELDEGSSFAESRLKAITGRDAITARFLHREFFDFVPTHKLTISGNHKPNVRGVDHGIWRRIRLVPFTVTIPKEERDTHLADKLRDELQGILNWAIEGCLIWQREGLQTPQCVAKATADYQANEDVVGQFLDDATEAETDDKTLQSSLFEAYQGWSEKQGIRKPMSATMLNRKLEERGLRKKKVNGGRYWDGIALKTEEGACFAPLIGKSLIPAHKENYRNGA